MISDTYPLKSLIKKDRLLIPNRFHDFPLPSGKNPSVYSSYKIYIANNEARNFQRSRSRFVNETIKAITGVIIIYDVNARALDTETISSKATRYRVSWRCARLREARAVCPLS